MLNNSKEYTNAYMELEEMISKVSIALLTKGKLVEEDLNSLYAKLIKMAEILANEKYLPKQLTSMLFQFYKRAEAEMSYLKPETANPSSLLVAYLQKYIGKILGE